MSRAVVADWNGSPSILFDGKPLPPMAMTVRTGNFRYLQDLGSAGIKLFFLICDTDWLRPEGLEELMRETELLVSAVPDALILLRVGLHPPLWWLERNRDQLMTYSDGSQKPATLYTESYVADMPAMYSLCSAKWRKDAADALCRFLDRLEQTPHADRYIGYFLAAGGTSEWYPINNTEDHQNRLTADHSEAFRLEFSDFLRSRYKDEETLRREWQDGTATFAHPRIPSYEERFFGYVDDRILETYAEFKPAPPNPGNGTNVGSFLDADRHQSVADFYRAWHLGTANSIVHFARVLKQRRSDRLVGAFYGSYGCTNFLGGGTAGGVLTILDSGAVDFLAAPGNYDCRQPGGYIAQREMQDSFRLRNTMFIVEDDTRTHLETPFYRDTMETYTIDDSYNVLKRDFGRNICEDLYGWWFDQHIGGGRYDHPEIFRLFARQQEIARFAYSLDRRKGNEIALIFDEESIHYVSQQTSHDSTTLFRTLEVNRIGAPVDYYFHNDLARPDMPDYKLYVFVNAYYLSDEEREAIGRKVKQRGRTALWLYAPGLLNPDRSPKLSASHIGELTGIAVEQLNETWSPRFKLDGLPHPSVRYADRDRLYGYFDRPIVKTVWVMEKDRPSYLYPVFYSNDPEATVLGRFCANGLPALTLKEREGFTSIFCGAKTLRSDLVQSIARHAGCHVYSRTDDCLYANRNFVVLHAKDSGRKTLRFPGPCSPYEVYEKRTYATDTDSIDVDMRRGETKMFYLAREGMEKTF